MRSPWTGHRIKLESQHIAVNRDNALLPDSRVWFLFTSFDVWTFVNKGEIWWDIIGKSIFFTVGIHDSRRWYLIDLLEYLTTAGAKCKSLILSRHRNDWSRKSAPSWKRPFALTWWPAYAGIVILAVVRNKVRQSYIQRMVWSRITKF